MGVYEKESVWDNIGYPTYIYLNINQLKILFI